MTQHPIIFLIFKRPEETKLVWEQIRKAQPKKLFIVADGARNDEEKKMVEAARAVVENIDWSCEVMRDYSETNLGCRKRVASGITWAFNQLQNDTDGAVILEDDCLPDQSFFSYCDEMLEKYKNTPEILHIGGTNFQDKNDKFLLSLGKDSYYFSHIAQIWGWATWKRAWKLYDTGMITWEEMKGSKALRAVFPNRLSYDYWELMFDRLARNETDTWDIAWTYTCFKEQGLAIMPKVNLISNIGSTTGATHKASAFSHLPTVPLLFPLAHPQKIAANKEADIFTYKKVFGINNSFTNSSRAFVKAYLPFLFKHVKSLVK